MFDFAGTPNTIFTVHLVPLPPSGHGQSQLQYRVSSLGLMITEQPAANQPATLRTTVCWKVPCNKGDNRANRIFSDRLCHARHTWQNSAPIDPLAFFAVPADDINRHASSSWPRPAAYPFLWSGFPPPHQSDLRVSGKPFP